MDPCSTYACKQRLIIATNSDGLILSIELQMRNVPKLGNLPQKEVPRHGEVVVYGVGVYIGSHRYVNVHTYVLIDAAFCWSPQTLWCQHSQVTTFFFSVKKCCQEC